MGDYITREVTTDVEIYIDDDDIKALIDEAVQNKEGFGFDFLNEIHWRVIYQGESLAEVVYDLLNSNGYFITPEMLTRN